MFTLQEIISQNEHEQKLTPQIQPQIHSLWQESGTALRGSLKEIGWGLGLGWGVFSIGEVKELQEGNALYFSLLLPTKLFSSFVPPHFPVSVFSPLYHCHVKKFI